MALGHRPRPVLAGSEPPYVERIAHHGALPELGRMKVNLYVADPVHSPAVEALAAKCHSHHFHCPACISAGRGHTYSHERCPTGMRLWKAYQEAIK